MSGRHELPGKVWKSLNADSFKEDRTLPKTALQLVTNSPGYETTHAADTAFVDVSGVHNEEEGTLSFFLVNRHTSESIETEVSLQGFAGGTVIDHQVMTHPDLKAVNTAKNQDEVKPKKGEYDLASQLLLQTVSILLPAGADRVPSVEDRCQGKGSI